MVNRLIGMVAACGLLSGAAGAHEFWVQPDRYRVEPGGLVRIGLFHGERFNGDIVRRDERTIERFELVGGDAPTPVRGMHRHEQSFLRPEAAGAGTIVYQSREFINVLPAARFEAYLAEEGLDEISRRRAAMGETDQTGREAYVRCAKALLTVESPGEGTDSGDSAASDGRADAAPAFPHDAPVGLPCEIVLLSGEAGEDGVTFQAEVLFEGEPLAGVRVVAVAASAHEELIELETDEHGRVEFVAEWGGPWLLTTLHMTRTDERDDVDWKSYWASLAFEF